MRRLSKFSIGLLLSLSVFTCSDNSTKPDDLSPGIYGTVKDANGGLASDVGVQLIFPLATYGEVMQSRSGPRVIFASQGLPVEYQLEQNFPNPFNPSTIIGFSLPEDNRVTLSIYDMNGKLTKKRIDENLRAGMFRVVWDGTNDAGANVTNGLYTYRLQAGDFEAEKTMLLDMLDPASIRQHNSLPLATSDENGEFQLSYSQIPFGRIVYITDETGPEVLGQFTISTVSLVLLKEGYQPLVQSLESDTTKAVTFDFTLVAD